MPKKYPEFFFSSRRRHTRLQGDWSSDVCSSDLVAQEIAQLLGDASDLLLGEALVEELLRLLQLRVARSVTRASALQDLSHLVGYLGYRSEERRVGKEWRSYWVHLEQS